MLAVLSASGEREESKPGHSITNWFEMKEQNFMSVFAETTAKRTKNF